MTDSSYAVRFLFIAGTITAFKQAIGMLRRGVGDHGKFCAYLRFSEISVFESLRRIHEKKSDSESKLTMSEFAEAIIYCVAPPPNRSLAPPDNVKLVASWQGGLQTPSGLRQSKLRCSSCLQTCL